MDKYSKRKGGGYPNQPGSREGNALSKTDKTANSSAFDEHLSEEDKLRQDMGKQKAHMDAVERRKAGERVDPNEVKLPDDESKPVPLESEEDDRSVVLGGDDQTVELGEHERREVLDQVGRLIVGLRIYDQNAEGSPRGRSATSKELLAKHDLIRREREVHIDQDGTHVRVGYLGRERKGKYLDEPTFWGPERSRERRVPVVMRSILGRLMPHEGEVSGRELTREMVEEAMDEAVAGFQKETGCEIISAAVHRMSDHDLHIHIQYTMVVCQRKNLGKHTKERKEWGKVASAMAREALLKEGVDHPNPSAIGAMKKRLVEAGKLVQEPEFKTGFRKANGLRSMGNGSILGHSYRNKLNVVRLAEEAELPDLAKRVIKLRDELGGFRPIAKRSDEALEEDYLDLWLERMWRRIVKARLSDDALDKIRTAGVVAATNYADFGAVKPKPRDLERMKVALMYKEAQLDWDRQIQEMEEGQRLDEMEHTFRERVLALVKRLLGLRKKLNLQRSQLRDQAKELAKREEKLVTREQTIDGREGIVKDVMEENKSLKQEVESLREKADLGDELTALWRQIISTPGLGKFFRDKFTKVWDRVRELGPRMGLENEIYGVDAIKSFTKKPDRGEQRPALPGDLK